MTAKKYPIGTKIKFVANESMCYLAKQDNGKTGEIIGETSCGNAKIFLINSVKKNSSSEYTWNTGWENIEPVIVKGQQLMFDFME